VTPDRLESARLLTSSLDRGGRSTDDHSSQLGHWCMARTGSLIAGLVSPTFAENKSYWHERDIACPPAHIVATPPSPSRGLHCA
jgi:hypothetical protein